MSKPVVVFGGSGFIGTHLIRAIAKSGESAIVSVDIRPPRETLAGVDYRAADVRDLHDFRLPTGAARIYNLAAVHTTPGHASHEYYETNVLGALEVTRLAAKYEVPEIVFTSSISVYGPGEETKTEHTPLAPTSAYGYSKMLAERMHRAWLDQADGRRLVVARPAVVFGPGEGGNFTRLAALLRKGFFVYPGRRDTIKSCIYVEDLIQSLEFARSQGENMVLFNGSYPQRYTLEQIVETLTVQHFSKARTFMLPRQAVMSAASLLKGLDALHIGIHPERVLKLVRSTDIYPNWLTARGRTFPNALERAFDSWSKETHGKFV